MARIRWLPTHPGAPTLRLSIDGQEHHLPVLDALIMCKTGIEASTVALSEAGVLVAADLDDDA